MMQRIFVGLVIALVVYELVALVDGAGGDTISEIMWTAAAHRPIVPFLGGLLAGHFFWQRGGTGA